MRKKSWNSWHITFFAVILIFSFALDSTMVSFFSWMRSPLLEPFFQWFSSIITVVLVLLIFSSFFMYAEDKTKFILPVWLSFFSALIASHILKFMIQRPRPVAVWVFNLPNYSFPSAHAAISFAVLPFLEKEFPKIKMFWIGFISLILLSRLYLGVCFLSDIVGGALFGYLIGYLVLKKVSG